MTSLNLIQVMIIKVPGNASNQVRLDIINDSITELQLNGYNILSIDELKNGSFLVQYRKFN